MALLKLKKPVSEAEMNAIISKAQAQGVVTTTELMNLSTKKMYRLSKQKLESQQRKKRIKEKQENKITSHTKRL